MSDKYDSMIRDALKLAQVRYGYGGQPGCLAIVKGQIETESSFNPDAKAKTSSATGLMQLTKAAAKEMGYASLPVVRVLVCQSRGSP